MKKNHDQSKKNVWAAAIGFVLIILAVFATLGRPYFFPQNNGHQNASAAQNLSKYKSISAKNLYALTQSAHPSVMLDVRDQNSFADEHILDSQNIDQPSLQKILASSDKNKAYYLIDDSGPTPTEIQVMDLFHQAGFKNVAYLEGGLTEWKNELYPTITIGDPYSFADQAKVSYISSDDLKKMLDANEELYIIDVRTTKEFSAGHIPGAVNIYLNDLETERRQIPLGKKIILYDNDSLWAFQGAVRLYEMGILNVFTLSDGFNAWTQKGYPVIK